MEVQTGVEVTSEVSDVFIDVRNMVNRHNGARIHLKLGQNLSLNLMHKTSGSYHGPSTNCELHRLKRERGLKLTLTEKLLDWGLSNYIKGISVSTSGRLPTVVGILPE